MKGKISEEEQLIYDMNEMVDTSKSLVNQWKLNNKDVNISEDEHNEILFLSAHKYFESKFKTKIDRKKFNAFLKSLKESE